MAKMKYVILKRNGLEVPFVFPETETHAQVAQRLNPSLERVISAGFCDVGQDHNENYPTWHCWGESFSLKISSRPEDAEIFNSAFRMNPY